jgi:glycosyltransferase involved in cell wall biosynthesis
MRILFLAPQPFFEVRGTPLAVLAMVKALLELGHQVDLLTYPQGEPVQVSGLRHHRSLPLPVGRVKAGPSLAKLLLDIPFTIEAGLRMAFGGYDVVHAVEEAAHLAAPLTRLFGLPLVMDVDSQIPDQLRYSGFATRGPLLAVAEALETHALRHAAVVITVCQSLTDGVTRIAPRERVFQIEDPPLVDAQVPDPSEVAGLRTSLGLGIAPVVLYAGNFEPYQGVETLVDAAALVGEAQFLFVGGEPNEIDALRSRAAGGAAARFVFAGKRPPANMPAFMALADVLVSPRLRGTNTPFKVYTYLASGKPLVATRLPTHTQLLDDSLAFLVDPTTEGLAAGIRAALTDREDAARRAARGRGRIERDFSRARFVEKVGRAYAVLSRGPEAGPSHGHFK